MDARDVNRHRDLRHPFPCAVRGFLTLVPITSGYRVVFQVHFHRVAHRLHGSKNVLVSGRTSTSESDSVSRASDLHLRNVVILHHNAVAPEFLFEGEKK